MLKSISISKRDRTLYVLLIPCLVFFMKAVTVFAGDATLSWDPPTTNVDDTPLTDLAGYKIYYGTASGSYDTVIDVGIDVGNPPNYQIANLTDNIIYYFTVTAYDTSDNESDYSNEVSKLIQALDNYTLTVSGNGTGTGTVMSSPAGIDCAGCSANYDAGTVVTLTAVPDTGSTFDGWSGACSGTGDCIVTISSDISVAAQFTACIDVDNDGFAIEGGDCGPIDCDDTNSAINPGASDSNCDGVDNDCNGIADDGYVTIPTTCGVGECASTGQIDCAGGTEADSCVPGIPGAEICDNLDNDCDSIIDENLTRATTCGVGECAGNTGVETCTAGTWGDNTCDPFAGATTEACNDTLDNDCDGATDLVDSDCSAVDYYCDNDTDGYISTSIAGSCLGAGCEPAGCVLTTGNDCDDANSAINPGVNDSNCDGVDNNCNAIADDGYVTTPTICGVGECASTGQSECIGGTEVDTCTPGIPSAEICDGLDNDCNGFVDDGIAAIPSICGVGVCASTGQIDCAGGTEVDSCTPGIPTEVPEVTCDDGLDNDCDGLADTVEDPDCSPVTYTITATAGSGGTISPSGDVIVDEVNDQTFTITPDTGYQILDVLVDGSSVGAVSIYTFYNVTVNHTIEAAFTCDISFADVPPEHWAEVYINAIACSSITTGYGDGTYRPENTVNRADMAAFIIRALYGETFSYSSIPYFPDVADTHWAFKYIQRLYEEGITIGYGDSTYRLENTVNRAQMAAFLSRAFLAY